MIKKSLYMIGAMLALAMVFSSCADDKGSYDYLDINEITIGGIQDEYHVIALRAPEPAITPKLEFTQYATDDLTYSWQVDSKEICNHPSLDVPIEMGEGEHSAMLVITNNETTLKYYYPFKLFVETQFTYGLAILSEREDGTSDLGFIPMTSKGEYSDAMTNVFEKLNPEWGTLGKHPSDMALRLAGEWIYNNSYMILNAEDKVFVQLDENSMEMKHAYTLHELPGNQTTWNPKGMSVNKQYALILANDRIFTFDQVGCDAFAEPRDYGWKMGWTDVGGSMTSYAIPAYDNNSHQFLVILQEEGRSFTYDDVKPFNELKNSPQTDPVIFSGLTMLAAERMYNDGGFRYNNGQWGSWGNVTGTGGEDDASTERFIFRDASGNAHFYTYDFEIGYYYDWMYNLEIKAMNSDYGVREDRVVSDLTFNDQTVCKALPYGRYWMIANGRELVREFYTEGAQRYQFSLPAEVKGNVVAMATNTDESLLYVATYDNSSTEEYKGSVSVYGLDVNGGTFGKLVKHFPNCCGKTVKMILREK